MTRNICSSLRASTLVDAKSCIIEKDTTFTHFASTMLHINVSKSVQRCVYLYTCYSNCVYIYTVIVARPYIILLISRLHLFFSLFSVHNELSNFSSPHLLFPQMLTNTPTHKHFHTDKSTQRYTNTPTHKQTHTDKPTKRQIYA